MFVDALDRETRSRVFERFFEETSLALVEVFDKSEGEAARMIDDLRRRFAQAPRSEQDLLLHDDPATLAGELADMPSTEIDEQRLRAFQRRRRTEMPGIEGE